MRRPSLPEPATFENTGVIVVMPTESQSFLARFLAQYETRQRMGLCDSESPMNQRNRKTPRRGGREVRSLNVERKDAVPCEHGAQMKHHQVLVVDDAVVIPSFPAG